MAEYTLNTGQKTLELNLDPSWYGSFAEIGAGQEVGDWFFRAGAAAGTVAKTMSAYDMQVSDAIYGKTNRYVSRPRLEAMLDHEFELNIERLRDTRGADTRFFAFADTVAAQRFGGSGHCHGWMGIRFQSAPLRETSQIVLHARLLNRETLLQHEALGILGVNLIYGASRLWEDPNALLASLSDELSPGRLEVDMIEFSGEAFDDTDNRVMSLKLVENKLTRVAMFAPSGEALQPSEALYKRPVVVQRGGFRPPTRVHADIQKRSVDRLARDRSIEREQVLPLVEMTLRELRSVAGSSVEDFLDRIEALGANDQPVLISDFARPHQIVEFLSDCMTSRIGIALNVFQIFELLSREHTSDLEGGLPELVGRVFRPGVCLLAYPALDLKTGERFELEDLEWPGASADLVRYLMRTDRIAALPGLDDDSLRIVTDEVLTLIQAGDPSWPDHVEPAVAEAIRRHKLFDLPG
jgi:hypothetical protein